MVITTAIDDLSCKNGCLIPRGSHYFLYETPLYSKNFCLRCILLDLDSQMQKQALLIAELAKYMAKDKLSGGKTNGRSQKKETN